MKPLLFPRDLLQILYLIYFKPITLERYMQQIDSSLKIDTNIIVLWRHSKLSPKLRPILWLSFFHIMVTPWICTLLIVSIFKLSNYDAQWSLVGLASMMAIGVGLVSAIWRGVALSTASSIALAIMFSVAAMTVTFSNVMFPLVLGVALGVVYSAVVVVASGMWTSLVVGLVVSILMGMGLSLLFRTAGGLAFGISFIVTHFRLINYVIESLYSFLFLSRGKANINFSPVMWDELIWLPLPGLDQQLVSIGKANREEGMKAIAYVASSFRQGWAARRALLELTAYDVQNSKSLESIASISETLSWLPPETRAAYKSLLLGLDTVSRHAKSAIESETLYNRQEQLRLALDTTQSIRKGFAYDPNWQISHLVSPALEVWERLLADELAAAQKQEAIPNVYVAGRPLDTKSKVFRGRRDVFKALERELISPAEQRPAVLLFGARRTGKTSVLRQIPETLGPQVISVAVDLQDAALEKDAASLLYKISEKMRNDALQFRHLEFNELSRATLEANPYSAFTEWLKKLQETIGEKWILLNLDEYEYLEKMVTDRRLDDRIFQLLRTLLQNHPRLTLLFSGAHTFEDLSPIWSHHLINARVIKIKPLSEGEARELITNPIPNYPLVYTENAVKDILAVTACQPYLIQAICRDLVNMKNEQHHFHASPKDVTEATESVLTSASPYFQDLWSGPDTDEIQCTIMGAIARSRSGKLSITEINAALLTSGVTEQVAKTRQAALRALEHRDVLKSDKGGWGFQVELVRRWIRKTQFGLKK